MMNHATSTVLLVEDSLNDVLLIQRAFRKTQLPISLQVVNDGDEAVSYLTGENQYCDRLTYPFPFIVLLDLKLPRRSGFEVLTWVRQRKEFKGLPVVILTSSGETTDIERGYELGANSYLVKPPSFRDLEGMVHAFCGYWLQWNQGMCLQDN